MSIPIPEIILALVIVAWAIAIRWLCAGGVCRTKKDL